MKIAKFTEFISESYEFKEYKDGSKTRIKYEFQNKDNLRFIVSFVPKKLFGTLTVNVPSSGIGGTFYREYIVDSDEDSFVGYYGEINTNDAMGIIRTVSNITVDFINKYKPDKIEIEHIPSRKEIEKYKSEGDFKEFKNIENQRAKINRKYLEPIIPNGYIYKLDGMISTISKI